MKEEVTSRKSKDGAQQFACECVMKERMRSIWLGVSRGCPECCCSLPKLRVCANCHFLKTIIGLHFDPRAHQRRAHLCVHPHFYFSTLPITHHPKITQKFQVNCCCTRMQELQYHTHSPSAYLRKQYLASTFLFTPILGTSNRTHGIRNHN